MCLNKTCSKVCIGKHLFDSFHIENSLKQDAVSLIGNKSFENMTRVQIFGRGEKFI